MIVSRSDPYGLRGMVRPGRAEEPGEPRARALRDKPENVRRCKTCTVPAELCYGLCRSDADQERARQGRRPAPERGYTRIDEREAARLAAEGMSYKEIAEKYGITVRRVEFELEKAVKQLRVALKDYLPVLLMLLSDNILRS